MGKQKARTKSYVSRTARLDIDLNRRVDHLIADTGENFQDFALRVIKQELDPEIKARTAEEHDLLADEHVRKLVMIKRSGDHDIIDAVTQNVEVFYDRLRPLRSETKGREPGDPGPKKKRRVKSAEGRTPMAHGFLTIGAGG